jgi:hypothetical protein
MNQKNIFLKDKHAYTNHHTINKAFVSKNTACQNVFGSSNIESTDLEKSYYCFNVQQ